MPQVFVQKSFEISGVILQSIREGKNAEDDFSLLETRLWIIASFYFSPKRIAFKFGQETIERPSVDTISQLLFVQRHRAAIKPFKYLVPEIGIRGHINRNAANWRIHNFSLHRRRKVLKQLWFKLAMRVSFLSGNLLETNLPAPNRLRFAVASGFDGIGTLWIVSSSGFNVL